MVMRKQKTKTFDHGSVTRDMFPHQSSSLALEECEAKILTTDGSYESQRLDDGSPKDPANDRPGSIIVVVPPGGTPRFKKLNDDSDTVPDIQTDI